MIIYSEEEEQRKTHLRTDLQVHLVGFHLFGAVVVVKSCLVHLVLTVHLKLVAAQRSEHLIFGELSVHVGSRQSLDVPEDVEVDSGVELLLCTLWYAISLFTPLQQY